MSTMIEPTPEKQSCRTRLPKLARPHQEESESGHGNLEPGVLSVSAYVDMSWSYSPVYGRVGGYFIVLGGWKCRKGGDEENL